MVVFLNKWDIFQCQVRLRPFMPCVFSLFRLMSQAAHDHLRHLDRTGGQPKAHVSCKPLSPFDDSNWRGSEAIGSINQH